jgi:hypothetical protein
MGSLNVKLAGTPTPVETPWGKVSGTWRRGKKLYTKIAGSWVLAKEYSSPPPSNMVIMYVNTSDVPGDATIQTGWNNYFPSGGGTALGTAGSDTHSAASHGATAASTSTYNHVLSRNYTITGAADKRSSHSHSISHTHPADSISHVPLHFTGIPTTGGSVIGANAFFPFANTLSASGWVALTQAVANYYLRFNSGNSTTGGSSTHRHNSYSYSTGNYNINSQISRNGITVYITHNHSATHRHPAITNLPSHYTTAFYQTQNDISFDEIPSGCVGFFTDTNIPTGWTALSVTDRIFRQSASPGSVAGVTSHLDPTYSGSTGGASFSNSTVGTNIALSNIWRPPQSHTHTMNHSHPTFVDWRPARIYFQIATKD